MSDQKKDTKIVDSKEEVSQYLENKYKRLVETKESKYLFEKCKIESLSLRNVVMNKEDIILIDKILHDHKNIQSLSLSIIS